MGAIVSPEKPVIFHGTAGDHVPEDFTMRISSVGDDFLDREPTFGFLKGALFHGVRVFVPRL
jgi:hypothetical protein